MIMYKECSTVDIPADVGFPHCSIELIKAEPRWTSSGLDLHKRLAEM